MKSLSHVRLFATPWTAAYQAPPSMGFFRQVSYSQTTRSSNIHGTVHSSAVILYHSVYIETPISAIQIKRLFPLTAAAAKSLQSCPTLCDPIDSSPLGSPVSGILQARTLEWVAISFSNAWKWKEKVKFLSRVRLLATPWTAAHQAPPSMGFSRQEYWSGVPFLSPGDLPRDWTQVSHIVGRGFTI